MIPVYRIVFPNDTTGQQYMAVADSYSSDCNNCALHPKHFKGAKQDAERCNAVTCVEYDDDNDTRIAWHWQEYQP